MFTIEHTTDFEMYSSPSKGAIQGYGYTFHTYEITRSDNFTTFRSLTV
jgi:hypothetical protein